MIFNDVREDERTINRVSKYLENQNKLKIAQLQAVMHYASDKTTCKSKLILGYFGESQKENCGICSYCISKNKTVSENDSVNAAILALLKTGDYNSRQIQNIVHHSSDAIIFALKNLLEDHLIQIKANNHYQLKK